LSYEVIWDVQALSQEATVTVVVILTGRVG
jgi:hypothetical protein